MDGRGPYGLACMNCFKAKSKCVGRPEGDGCQRCHRLKKQCNPSDSIRRRNSQKAQSSRIAQLESKLDDLFSLLQAVQQPPAPTSTASQTSVTGDHSSSDTSMSLPSSVPPTYHMPADESRNTEESLALFRDTMLRACPFIYLPPTVTAQYLQKERPFFFQAVLAVTTRSMREKRMRAQQFKATLAQATVVENRSSIDLLLGLLTYVAWGYDHFIHSAPTTSRLMQIALSIVYDVHLNKPLPGDHHMMTLLGGKAFCSGSEAPERHSLEEQRAVLGCFLLASVISSYFAQNDPMRWTSQMEDFLRTVEANAEHQNDHALALHVRLQLLAQRAAQVRDEHNGLLPIAFFLTSFRGQLEALRASIPLEHPNKYWLLAHLYYVELSINSTAFLPQGSLESPAGTPSAPSPPNSGSDWERVDSMQGSVKAIKSWMDVFFAFKSTDCMAFTIHLWAQLARSLVTLYRLSTYTEAGWDPEVVCNTVDLLEVVKHTTQKMDHIAGPNPVSDDFWTQVARLGAVIRAWLESQLQRDGNEGMPGWAPSGCSASGTQFPWDMSAELTDSLAYGNETWLQTLSSLPLPGSSMRMPP
ncbi:Zn(II)2Cys6 transcription factor domain-containing protein [Aspergillus lucknowensis]|uniref:Zn(2)-C6 fungal-type domain-containing protein n=1 Tax=Aspergillus lucknowensis TaxID=176173 RepID=A0ABR4LHZ3_9EURO